MMRPRPARVLIVLLAVLVAVLALFIAYRLREISLDRRGPGPEADEYTRLLEEYATEWDEDDIQSRIGVLREMPEEENRALPSATVHAGAPGGASGWDG